MGLKAVTSSYDLACHDARCESFAKCPGVLDFVGANSEDNQAPNLSKLGPAHVVRFLPHKDKASFLNSELD